MLWGARIGARKAECKLSLFTIISAHEAQLHNVKHGLKIYFVKDLFNIEN